MASKDEKNGEAILFLMLISAFIGGCISFGTHGTIQSAFLGIGIGAAVPLALLTMGLLDL